MILHGAVAAPIKDVSLGIGHLRGEVMCGGAREHPVLLAPQDQGGVCDGVNAVDAVVVLGDIATDVVDEGEAFGVTDRREVASSLCARHARLSAPLNRFEDAKACGVDDSACGARRESSEQFGGGELGHAEANARADECEGLCGA